MAFAVLEYNVFRFGDILTFLFYYANEESDDVTVKKN